MLSSYTSLVLAALSIGSAIGNPLNHARFHKKSAAPEEFAALISKRGAHISEGDSVKLLSELEFTALGVNGDSSDKGVWFGKDGPYTNEFTNDSGKDLILVLWGAWGSWVNAVQPLITHSMSNGTSTTLSFANGQTGAWAAIYDDTKMLNGQISNTWGEYTFSPYGVVDVSREPNMKGNSMSIVGPTCTSDMETCVFVCKSGDVCMTDYELENCAAGSQPHANYGIHEGAPSGGCGGLGDGAAVKTYLS